ncbi:UNVERIFIED_CONTAM: hypothetical protein Sangu_3010100 [Sesamum angustifolium]|uniref:Uncharacterized protein n=1 Tax=Sesamum angustifolium TaxID=2727405 RepID=A0AAW2KNM8_9LAMI
MRRRREWITFSNRHRIGQWRKSPALPEEYGQSGMNEREAPRIPGSPEKALFLSLATPIGNALLTHSCQQSPCPFQTLCSTRPSGSTPQAPEESRRNKYLLRVPSGLTRKGSPRKECIRAQLKD